MGTYCKQRRCLFFTEFWSSGTFCVDSRAQRHQLCLPLGDVVQLYLPQSLGGTAEPSVLRKEKVPLSGVRPGKSAWGTVGGTGRKARAGRDRFPGRCLGITVEWSAGGHTRTVQVSEGGLKASLSPRGDHFLGIRAKCYQF